MRFIAALVPVNVILLLAPGGCRRGTSDGKESNTMEHQLQLTAADEGQTRSAIVGQNVSVALEETPSTGYLWTLQGTPPQAVGQVTSEWLAPGTVSPGSEAAGQEPAVGGAGVRTFHLRVQIPGQVLLQATLARPWESGATPLARYDVRLRVTSKENGPSSTIPSQESHR